MRCTLTCLLFALLCSAEERPCAAVRSSRGSFPGCGWTSFSQPWTAGSLSPVRRNSPGCRLLQTRSNSNSAAVIAASLRASRPCRSRAAIFTSHVGPHGGLFPVHLGVFRRYFTETAAAVNESRGLRTPRRTGPPEALCCGCTSRVSAPTRTAPRFYTVRVYLGGIEAQTISSRVDCAWRCGDHRCECRRIPTRRSAGTLGFRPKSDGRCRSCGSG